MLLLHVHQVIELALHTTVWFCMKCKSGVLSIDTVEAAEGTGEGDPAALA